MGLRKPRRVRYPHLEVLNKNQNETDKRLRHPSVRLALLKNFNVDAGQTFCDYKKFRTDAKIVGIGDVQPEK